MKPADPMTTDEFLDNARRHGALVSGKPVPADFVNGWGTHPFTHGMKAHYWTGDRQGLAQGYMVLRSACGQFAATTPQVPLLQPGNLPFCARCEAKLMKAARA